jgi:hypothetical protein
MREDPRTIEGFACLSYISDDIFDCGTVCSQNRGVTSKPLDMGQYEEIKGDSICRFKVMFWDEEVSE